MPPPMTLTGNGLLFDTIVAEPVGPNATFMYWKCEVAPENTIASVATLKVFPPDSISTFGSLSTAMFLP